MATHVRGVVKALETLAPPHLAAEWDNVGLLVGDRSAAVRKLLLCIDLTEAVLAEARRAKAEMIVAYHPAIFKPIGRVTASEAPTVFSAARSGLAVYCPHTALDAAPGGTNDVLAGVLGLSRARPIEPCVSRRECKLVVFVPPDDLHRVAEAAFGAGAGRIGEYRDCSFFSHGIGTFCGAEGTRPAIGLAGQHEAAEEVRLEVVVPRANVAAVCEAVRAVHGYEAPAIDVYPLEHVAPGCGMGRIGRFDRPVTVRTLIGRVKKALGVSKVLLAAPPGRRDAKVSIAACCAGSCGDMVHAAARGGASFYLTGELRHHDALSAVAEGMTVVCVGHSNSERIALKALSERLVEKIRGLRTVLSKRDVDPFTVA